MRRLLLAVSALLWAAFLAWSCASVHESMENIVTRNGEACDEGLSEADVDSIYSWGLTP